SLGLMAMAFTPFVIRSSMKRRCSSDVPPPDGFLNSTRALNSLAAASVPRSAIVQNSKPLLLINATYGRFGSSLVPGLQAGISAPNKNKQMQSRAEIGRSFPMESLTVNNEIRSPIELENYRALTED